MAIPILVTAARFAVLLVGFFQPATQEPVSPAKPTERLAATVSGVPIRWTELEAELKQVLGDRELEPAARVAVEARVLKLLVDRLLVGKRLTREQRTVGASEVEQAIRRLQAVSSQQGVSWPDYLRRSGGDEAVLRKRLAWQLSWVRYVESYRTDENLQRYFEKHRPHFDGTRVKVAHLLLAVADSEDPGQRAAAIEQANQIRGEILAGKVSFAAATAKYSTAPTAEDGGGIGWISRHDPMPEPFSRAAFELQEGQVSSPVVTDFGIHLILCQQIEPGKRTWEQVRDELEVEIAKYLFSWCADQERPTARIELQQVSPELRAAWSQFVPTSAVNSR